MCGDATYAAPEMLLGVGHSFGVDHWALGCVIFELLTGRTPFEAPLLGPTGYGNFDGDDDEYDLDEEGRDSNDDDTENDEEGRRRTSGLNGRSPRKERRDYKILEGEKNDDDDDDGDEEDNGFGDFGGVTGDALEELLPEDERRRRVAQRRRRRERAKRAAAAATKGAHKVGVSGGGAKRATSEPLGAFDGQ